MGKVKKTWDLDKRLTTIMDILKYTKSLTVTSMVEEGLLTVAKKKVESVENEFERSRIQQLISEFEDSRL